MPQDHNLVFEVACSLPQQLDLEIPVVQLGRGGLGTACLLEDNLGVSISPSCYSKLLRVTESELGFVLRLLYDCSLVFNRREMMKSRSFWLSLVLLGVFPLVTRGWMDSAGSRRLFSDAGRLQQEVL